MCRLSSNQFNMKGPDDNIVNGEDYGSDEYDLDTESFPPPIRDGDFSEYMWMENEEEFDTAVMRQLEEEELIEECVTEMVYEELEDVTTNGVTTNVQSLSINSSNPVAVTVTSQQQPNTNCNVVDTQSRNTSSHRLQERLLDIRQRHMVNLGANELTSTSTSTAPVSQNYQSNDWKTQEEKENNLLSTLNPDAKEFVPTGHADHNSAHANGEVSYP